VHTDASARFERGADPTAMIPGAGRVAAILGRVGWRVVGTTGVVGHPLPAPPIVPIDVAAAAAFLEHPLTEDEVRSRLTRYGFEVSPAWPDWSDEEGWEDVPALDSVPKDRLRTTLLVRVPGHRRWDVETTFDLYEELAKSIGYNQTPERLPPIDLGAVPSTLEKNRQLVDQALVAAGFFEIFTDGFYGRDLLERAGVGAGHPLAAHVETANALDRGYSLLKNQCVLQAVDAVATNLRLKTEEIRAFEWTRTFRPDPTADNGVCTEHPVLWAIACGAARTPGWDGAQRRFDAFHAKALVEALSTATRIPLSLSAPEEDEGHAVSSLLHPKRQLLIRDGAQVVGVVGEVHPAVIKGFKLKKERPIYVEIDAAVFGRAPVRPDYVEPPVHQPIDRALAFTLPRGVEAGAIVAQLVRSGPAWLRAVRVTDEYLHPDADGARTLTFSLSFAQDADPRTSDEVNGASEAMIRAVESRFGPAGVKLR
jgi:phenylalanyl-tRNA synthetase beta chain